MADDNYFDQAPKYTPKVEPWPEEPPLPDSEERYGDVRAFPSGERQTAIPSAPALWHSDEPWDEGDIPRRPWIVPGYIIRGSVTLIAGAGSAGKSSLLKGWGIGLALGRSYNRFMPPETMRVMSYNVEDDLDEERRRISATLRQFNVGPEAMERRFRIIGPQHVGTLIHRDPQSGYVTNTQAMDELEAMIDEFAPDVLFLDPLVELHTAEENDNTGLRAVVAAFRQLAIAKRIAIVIAHHTRKGAVQPGDPDAVRGAGAIVGAARVVYTVCSMSEDEAAKCGVKPDRRRFYFRIDSAKSNYAPLDGAEWFERVPYELANGEDVAAAVPWMPPSPWDGMTWLVIDQIVQAIDRGPSPGEFYSGLRQSKDRWVGNVITRHTDRTPEQAGAIVKTWIDNGLLNASQYHSAAMKGRLTGCVHVDATKFAEMRLELEGGE